MSPPNLGPGLNASLFCLFLLLALLVPVGISNRLVTQNVAVR